MVNIMNSLNKILLQFKFKTLLSDNDKEFSNKSVADWCHKNNLAHKFSIPYYHPSNGRIDRVNRTIREALKRTKRKINNILQKVINSYNDSFHRAIGMIQMMPC
ncbi:Transposon Tf2-8 polyprotein [Dictyocoela muelleri]|nr:Transposon Tf2-8 polyprotein [Dictyocoela muelleri]